MQGRAVRLRMGLAQGAALLAMLGGGAHADTLADAIDAAYRNNPTLAAARIDTRSADEGVVQARSGYLPQVDLTASVGMRSSELTPLSGIPSSEDTDPQQIGVEAVQPVFTGGRLNAQQRLARAQALGARANLRSVEQQVLLAVIAAYEDVRRTEEIVRIRQNNVDVLARNLSAARDRFEVGEITRTDVAQSEARLAGGQAGLSAAESDLEAARALYIELVGEAPENLSAPPPHPPLPQSLDEAIDLAIGANPDLAAAEQARLAALSRVGVERSALLPQISIVGRWSSATDQAGPGYDSEETSAVAQFSMPLFEGGFYRSRVRQANLDADAAVLRAEAIRRAVIAGVVAAWNDFRAAQRVVDSAREQARANRLALEGVETEQLVGMRTTLEVLNAQQEMLDAELGVVEAERDLYVAAHVLLAAIGALDARTLAINAPLYDPDEHAPSLMRGMLPWAD